MQAFYKLGPEYVTWRSESRISGPSECEVRVKKSEKKSGTPHRDRLPILITATVAFTSCIPIFLPSYASISGTAFPSSCFHFAFHFICSDNFQLEALS